RRSSGLGGAELGNLLALGIVGSCFQFESRNERGYRVDVVSDHVGATAHGFHQAGSPSDEGIQGHRAVQRHLTQEGVPKAVRFISIKRKTGQDWPELRTEASGEPAVNPIERVRALTFPHGKFSDFGNRKCARLKQGRVWEAVKARAGDVLLNHPALLGYGLHKRHDPPPFAAGRLSVRSMIKSWSRPCRSTSSRPETATR